MTRVREDLSRDQSAALVCAALDRAGIPVVLSGGAVHPVDLDRVGNWSRNEAAAGKFETFLEVLSAQRSG